MLSLVFVLGTVTMVNANSNVIEEDGCAGDCVRSSKAVIMRAVDEYGLDISAGGADYGMAMEAYMAIYTDCVGGC